MRRLDVHLLPALVQPEELNGWSVVVIDVLRASSTICQALTAGALQVYPCANIELARAKAAELEGEQVLLGGEREGVRIEGFDLGNSPREYTAERVGGKSIVFTTTNGTLAIARADQAAEVVIGCLNNVEPIARHLAARERVAILCAGTQGRISAEDVAAAGAIAKRLQGDSANRSNSLENEWRLNDEARIAQAVYGDGQTILQVLRDSRGGQNLQRLRYDADIDIAAQLNSLDIVPRLDRSRGTLIKEVASQ